jgi:fimbrial chaperone protein
MARRARLAAILVSLPVPALAASLTAAPTRVDLAWDDRAEVVTLRNNAADPVMVQVQTFAWADGPATAELAPTRDLLAVPPVFELPAAGSQIIRVALRGSPSGDREQAYRLLITEVPRGAGGGTGVRFALRLSLPVFVIPPGAAPRAVWSVRGFGARRELVLRNDGTAHLQVRRITLAAGKNAAAGRIIETPAYVLAGQEHAWPLPASMGAADLQLEAESSIGPLSAAVALPRD